MKARRGFVLVTTLLLSAAMILLILGIAGRFSQMQKLDLTMEADLIAQSAADAGLDDAMYQLKLLKTWNTGFTNAPLASSGATYNVTFAGGAPVHSTNNGNKPTPTVGFDGRTVPPFMVYVVSMGTYQGVSHTQQGMYSVFKQKYVARW